MILRHTADSIRVTIEAGIVHLGLEAMNRKPLAPAEVALMAEVVGLCDSEEVPRAIKLARACGTPREVWVRLDPAPKSSHLPRRGSVRSVRSNASTGFIEVERW